MSAARHLARAGLIVSGAFLVSRLLGWVRVVVIGNAFGASAELDAFYAAFRIPDLLYQLVAAGALSSALIPVLAELFARDEHVRAWRVVSTIADLILAGLVVLGLVVLVTAPALVDAVIAPGFDPETKALTVDLTRVMVLSATFLALGALATSALNARRRFAAAAIAPIVYNLAIIGGAVILAPTMGALGLALGVVAGALGHLVIQLPALGRLGYRWSPALDLADPATRQALGLMVPRAIGLGASQITFVVVTALATTLGVGAVTAFTIAFTLLQIPVGLIGVPLGIVLFPSLSHEVATGDMAAFRGLLGRALRAIIVVMLPVAVLTALLRTETVALLFPTFSAADVRQTADTLLAFSLGLVAHALIAVLARGFYAQQDTRTPVVAAILAVAINTTLAAVLIRPLGLPGVGLAIAVAAWLETATLAVLLWRRVHGLDTASLVSVAVRTAVAAAVGGAVGLALQVALGSRLLPDPVIGGLERTPSLLAVMLVVSAGVAGGFVAGALALRITELRSIVGLMIDALRRPRRS